MQKKPNTQEYLLLLTGAYCVISVMMNYLCMKPMSFGTNWVWMDGGLLVSWLVFLISNIIVEVYGKRTALIVTLVATLVAFVMSWVALLEVQLPTLPQYDMQATHFAYIFSNAPRTIIASAIAFAVSGVVNIKIIAAFKAHADVSAVHTPYHTAFVFRAIVAALVGQSIDNLLFQVLAFAPVGLSLYEMYWRDIWSAVCVSTLFETLVEAIFVPLVALPITRYLQRNDKSALAYLEKK